MSAERVQSKAQADTTEEEYARLGKLLTRAVRRDNIHVSGSWPRFLGVSFLRGLFMGLGSVVGATILVAIAVWLLNTFDWLPVIGDWLDKLQQSLQNGSLVN